MFYEVQIPSPETKSRRTLQIEASSWRSALATSLSKALDEPPKSLEGFFVDIQDDVVTVTDPVGRRTVRILSVDKARVRQSQVMQALTGAHRAISVDPRPAVSTSQRQRPLGFKDKATGAFRAIVPTEIQQPQGDAGGEGRLLAETVAPAVVEAPELDSALLEMEPGAPSSSDAVDISETALEDVFLEIPTIFEPEYAVEDAIDFVLDLAFRYVPSGTAGLLFASDTADHMYFAACRGRGKKKLLDAQFDIQKGIPAASLRDGLAISTNPASDSRNTDELEKKSGVKVKSICCAPIQCGPRAFGVLLLLNRKERSFYSQYDANIVSYIGSQMGRFIQDQLDAAPLE